MDNLLYVDASSLLRVLITGPVIYLLVVAAVRVSGKRSTSQMNNFDWIVVVMIGSVAASGVILDTVPLIEAVAAIAILMGAQWLLTWATYRWQWLNDLIRARPTVLFERGTWYTERMAKERIVESEIYAAVREAGKDSFEEVEAVVLETDACLSVIGRHDKPSKELLEGCCASCPPISNGRGRGKAA